MRKKRHVCADIIEQNLISGSCLLTLHKYAHVNKNIANFAIL